MTPAPAASALSELIADLRQDASNCAAMNYHGVHVDMDALHTLLNAAEATLAAPAPAEAYDPTTQPFDEPFRHVAAPAVVGAAPLAAALNAWDKTSGDRRTRMLSALTAAFSAPPAPPLSAPRPSRDDAGQAVAGCNPPTRSEAKDLHQQLSTAAVLRTGDPVQMLHDALLDYYDLGAASVNGDAKPVGFVSQKTMRGLRDDGSISQASICRLLTTTFTEPLYAHPPAPSAEAGRVGELEAAAREYMSAAEAVFDWMNGNDLVADHHDQYPEDYDRINAATDRLRVALSGGAK